MTRLQWHILFSLLGIVLIGGCTWLWFDQLEKKWEAHRHISAAARENRMLAATRLLRQHRYRVDTESTLGEALIKPVPGGTLILAENGGVVTEEQAKRLLAWVRQGNTLIAQPKWSNATHDDDDDEAEGKNQNKRKTGMIETDPVGAYLGVVLASLSGQNSQTQCPKPDTPDEPEVPSQPKPEPKKNAAHLVGMTLPDAPYALQLETGSAKLRSTERGLPHLFSDEAAIAVRVYAEGKGHIVMLSKNYFDNYSLGRYDHAELLLGMTQLNQSTGSGQHVLIVHHLDMLSWYQALWLNFQLAIISIGCGLLLLLWTALRRFGPLLPEPERERRSLIEHIDASARWLWKVPGGRDILLAAARASTNQVLQRRVPELQRLQPGEQIRHLARHCNLATAHLASALQQPASRSPIDFTRQIQTLQHLRKYYER